MGAATACATTYVTEGLGAYDEFRPYARITSSSYDVEIDRPGYVAILSIAPAAPGYDTGRTLTFRPLYPLTEADTGRLEAGRQRVWSRRVLEPMRRLCTGVQIPSLGGCRAVRPGAGRYRDAGSVPGHYLMVVSETLVDPYTLAFHLEEARADSEAFMVALHERDARAASLEIARAIGNMPGSPYWAGLYVVRR